MSNTSSTSRRRFLQNTGRFAAASALMGAALPHVHAAEDNTIRIALIGCGGRGSGAAGDALSIDKGPIKVVAMADAFPDRMSTSFKHLKDQFGDRMDVPEDRKFVGFNAYQQAMVSAQTYPFRVQGTQIQVLSGTQAISNALVYRLPAGQPDGGCPMGGGRGGCTPPDSTPFVTNARGFLQGQGQVEPGDRLLALAPVDWTPAITWATGLTETMQLYYTNGAPTEVGVDALISNTNSLTVARPGLQQLTVSSDHPLLLFDLYMSLEWDPHKDLP